CPCAAPPRRCRRAWVASGGAHHTAGRGTMRIAMRTSVAGLLIAWSVLAGVAVTARAAEPPPSPRVRVELLSEVGAISPGVTFWIGLRQRIEPGWHTYWMNPGDSGEPPRIEWAPAPGFTLGEFAWPPPERIRVGPAMTFGYSDEVVLPLPVT